MLATICDICKKVTEPFELQQKIEGLGYVKLQVAKNNEKDKRGVYYKPIDVCSKCYIEILEKCLHKEPPPPDYQI